MHRERFMHIKRTYTIFYFSFINCLDKNNYFAIFLSLSRAAEPRGERGYLTLFWIGIYRQRSKTLTLLKTLESNNSIPYSRQIGKKWNLSMTGGKLYTLSDYVKTSILPIVPYPRHKNMKLSRVGLLSKL